MFTITCIEDTPELQSSKYNLKVPPRYVKQCAAAKEDFLPYRRKVEHSD
jgi:hypothetical protein